MTDRLCARPGCGKPTVGVRKYCSAECTQAVLRESEARCCAVCGVPLRKRSTERLAKFQRRKTCGKSACAGKLSATTRPRGTPAQLAAARAQKGRPAYVGGWPRITELAPLSPTAFADNIVESRDERGIYIGLSRPATIVPTKSVLA